MRGRFLCCAALLIGSAACSSDAGDDGMTPDNPGGPAIAD